jgi:inhibitor of KinA
MTPEVRLLPLGERAWTVEFGVRMDPTLHRRVTAFSATLRRAIDAGAVTGIEDVVPTFRSATVFFDPAVADGDRLGEQLLAFAADPGTAATEGLCWRIPVSFGGARGPDLEDVAQACGLGPDQVVKALTGTTFEAYVMGFMPGFAYLGMLPEALDLPRRATPRTRVPARTLAIAGRLCGVYPFDSPGGWHLLGGVPLPMFDLERAERPALLSVGDRIDWYAVAETEFARIERAVTDGELPAESFLVRDPA